MAAMTPTMVSHAVMLRHYGGFTTLIVENLMSEVLKEIRSKMLSTIILEVTSSKVIFSSGELSGRSPFITNFEHIEWVVIEWIVIFARHTVDFAPMLVILVIAARTHALQTDPKNGAWQRLAQTCFYDCTAAVAGQKLLALVLIICMEFECQETYTEDDVVFVMKGPD